MSGQDDGHHITFGIHYMVDGYRAPAECLRDREQLTSLLHELPAKLGMHTLHEPLVIEVGPKSKKDGGGLSGFVIVAESHISFHTFPNRGFVSIDVYTCQDDLDTDALFAGFKEAFRFVDQDVHLVKRGVRYPASDIFEAPEPAR